MNRLALKPYLINVKLAHRKGVVRFLKNGSAIIKFHGRDFKITRNKQYDLTQATIFGLNERLTSVAQSPKIDNGFQATLRELFNKEWVIYQRAMDKSELLGFLNYGVYAFYQKDLALVRYCPQFWHRTVAVASSSMLLSDPNGQLLWRDVQKVLSNTVIAIAGGSVGNNVAHSSVMDMRPNSLKIADKSLYKMENINRVRLQYRDIVAPNSNRLSYVDMLLRNKAEVLAEQIYGIDPFVKIYVYNEGVSFDTIDQFLSGKGGEPKADIVIEEVDDPRVKIFIREEARKKQLPLIMVTDVGSSVQLDVCRYDLDRTLPLTYGVSDLILKKSADEVYNQPGNRAVFFNFVDKLIGRDYRQGELERIISEKCEIPTSTIIPQLGSTAAMAGAIAAETIARIRLGHKYPNRVIINKHNFKIKLYE